MGDGRPSDANPFDLGSSELEAVRGAVFPPAPHPPPQIPDHEILRRVGIGAYGEVWLARNATGSYRAVKVVHRSSFDSDRPYQREFGGIKKF